jgi:hypothetical protein
MSLKEMGKTFPTPAKAFLAHPDPHMQLSAPRRPVGSIQQLLPLAHYRDEIFWGKLF